jgi:molybdopterin/thiamine biosynthesis adenylyltransferase
VKHLERQSFLGPKSPRDLNRVTLAIVGLGGGGSHVAQQSAHLGIGRYRLFDPDVIEMSNLNRLVGGTVADVAASRSKVEIARRMIAGVIPDADIATFQGTWQDHSDVLVGSDIVIGCLDSVRAKADLEALCRRMLIPMIDIGMDVHSAEGAFLISGQVALSTPPGPCLRCMGIINEANLAAEAQRYGFAGSQPQVVWSNGLLASAAVGLIARLVAPWHPNASLSAYLEYDGNRSTLRECSRLDAVRDRPCPHHPANETGELFFDIRARRGNPCNTAAAN